MASGTSAIQSSPEVGRHLRAMRRALGMRQVDLALAADVSVAWVRMLEQGVTPEKSEALERVHRALVEFETDSERGSTRAWSRANVDAVLGTGS